MAYKYVSPLDKGMKRIPIKRSHHNIMIPNRKKPLGSKVEYYWDEENKILIIEYYHHWIYKTLIIPIMVIPSILMEGIPNTFREITNFIFERRRGGFVQDRIFMKKHDENSNELANYIEGKKTK